MKAMRLLALVLIAAGCYEEPHIGGGDGGPIDAKLPDGPLPPHALRKAITIDGTKVGNVTNFPVWIDLRGGDVPAKAQPDGSDIEFTDAQGVVIASDIVAFQATTRLAAWVKIAQLQHDMDESMYVKYGDPKILPRNPQAVWDNRFVAVWHTNDSLSDGRVADSTGARDGTAMAGLDATHVVAGPLGGAFDFDADLNTVTFSNPFAGNSPHTISAWVNTSS